MSDGDVDGRLIDGRFRLITLLGEGQVGEVWQAVDEETGQPVAVRLHRAGAVDELAAQLRHPYVVSTFFFGTHEGATFTVMELVDGVSLATVLEEGPIPAGDAMAIAVGVSEALRAAHAAGVVHGNLKPSNVLITDGRGKFPVVKVGDFTGHGHPHEDMYALGQLMEAMSGDRDPAVRDPIVERLLSRDPYSPAQLLAILTGSPAARAESDEADADDGQPAARPRLVKVAVITGATTLAIVIAMCAWFLKPSTPPDIRSQTPFSEQPPSAVDPSPLPSAELTSPRPAAPPAVGTGANADNTGNRTNTTTNPAVSAAKAVVAGQLKAGNIQPDAASSLNAKLDEIDRFLSRGLTKQASDRVAALKSLLSSMLRSDRVNTTGYDAILDAVDALPTG